MKANLRQPAYPSGSQNSDSRSASPTGDATPLADDVSLSVCVTQDLRKYRFPPKSVVGHFRRSRRSVPSDVTDEASKIGKLERGIAPFVPFPLDQFHEMLIDLENGSVSVVDLDHFSLSHFGVSVHNLVAYRDP